MVRLEEKPAGSEQTTGLEVKCNKMWPRGIIRFIATFSKLPKIMGFNLQ
jgi:uncharacterized protein YeaO (DUF488 family)